MRWASLALLLVAGSAWAAPNIVVVSLDTTRTDALSCYGRLPGLAPSAPVVRTPNLDALAADGLRFEHFYATAPTTLSSHSTLFTGQDPHQHAVPRNGFPLAADVPTLASRLQREGWDTIAVVGAAVLDSELGLDRGFRVYDDRVGGDIGAVVQDRAERVVERVFAAVDARTQLDQPLFLFAHFYDAHAPYDPPTVYRDALQPPGYFGRFAHGMRGKLGPLRQAIVGGSARAEDIAAVNGLYQAEVSYVDAQLGRMLGGLSQRGLLDNTLVVVVADHGESLHTNPNLAYTHGAGVTDDVTRVPLLMRVYGDQVMMRRGLVERSASMTCLAPTIERLAGLSSTLGEDCWQLVRPGPVDDRDGWPEHPTPVLYAEATRPHQKDSSSWNNLLLRRSTRVGEVRLLRGPLAGEAPVLTGVAARGEARRSLREVLLTKLRAWDDTAPGFRDDDPEGLLRSVLESLGYVEPERPAAHGAER